MQDDGEGKALSKKFSDKARKVTKRGDQFLVPHKFTPDGDVVDLDNFDSRRDLSKLSLDDFRFLASLQKNKWDIQKAADECLFDLEQASKRFKKLSYFKFEESKAKALASVASPDLVTSKHIENLYDDNLTDNQRDSLKELAKITGAYKPTTTLNVNAHILQMPEMSAEEEKKAREFFDTIAVEEFKHAV